MHRARNQRSRSADLARVTSQLRELSGRTYPVRLRDLPRPPERVWVAGDLPRGPAVAIVGTRHPSVEGAAFARALARDLAEEGVAIFSGGAVGIDTAAHLGALDARGTTVVVAPASFDCPYPPENSDLFQRVVDAGGAFVTSFPPGTRARRHQFFLRNGQLAALTSALVVVETRYEGGARNAAAAARKIGRPVLAVPGAPWTPEASGCILELRLGARLAASAADVLDVLGLAKHRPRPEPMPERDRGEELGSGPPAPETLQSPRSSNRPDRDRVLGVLRKGPAHPDALCEMARLPAAQVQALLLTLTLEGIVVSEPSGRVSLASF